MIRFVNLQALLLALWVETSFSFNVPLDNSSGKPRLQMRVSSCNLFWWLEARFFAVEKGTPSVYLLACCLLLSCFCMSFETLRG